jgi:uncharacterized membrane protein
MNKAEFLNELTLCLQDMNDTERNKFVVYYDEMISDYMENGMKEEIAVNKIGIPKKIAEELINNNDNVRIDLPSSGNKVLNRVLTIIGFPLWGSVLLSVILLVFSIYVLIWCVPFAAAAGSVGFLASSILGIIGSPFVMVRNISVGMMQHGTGIASIGISLLLGIVTIQLSKKFVVITKNFNRKLTALFKKKVVIR